MTSWAVTTEWFLSTLYPRSLPQWTSPTGSGMAAHLVRIEVEEDPYSHLCDEDQQKEHEVLGQRGTELTTDPGVSSHPRKNSQPGALGPTGSGAYSPAPAGSGPH